MVIISPSHVESFDNVALFGGSAYSTPLGEVPVDADALTTLLTPSPPDIEISDHGHVQPGLTRKEHAIEIELPFVQRIGGDRKLVAIVMGDQDWTKCNSLADALTPLVADPRVLVVASSDLSHFYDAKSAERLDHAFCTAFEALDARALYDAIASGTCEACGAGPVVAALLATEQFRRRRARILSYTHSGQVTGDTTSVVGYAAGVVTTDD